MLQVTDQRFKNTRARTQHLAVHWPRWLAVEGETRRPPGPSHRAGAGAEEQAAGSAQTRRKLLLVMTEQCVTQLTSQQDARKSHRGSAKHVERDYQWVGACRPGQTRQSGRHKQRSAVERGFVGGETTPEWLTPPFFYCINSRRSSAAWWH